MGRKAGTVGNFLSLTRPPPPCRPWALRPSPLLTAPSPETLEAALVGVETEASRLRWHLHLACSQSRALQGPGRK